MELFLIPLIITIALTGTIVTLVQILFSKRILFKGAVEISIGEYQKNFDTLLISCFLSTLIGITAGMHFF